MAKINGAFVPVSDPKRSAEWYSEVFGLSVAGLNPWSAVLAGEDGGAVLTVLGPESGIQATPGLPWATHSLLITELDDLHADLTAKHHEPSEITGDPQICRWFSVSDPDGNAVLVVDR